MHEGLIARIDRIRHSAEIRAVVGPMFSGKTLEGVQALQKAEYGIRDLLKNTRREPSEFTIVFKPSTDDRTDRFVYTHSDGIGREGVVIPAEEPERMLEEQYNERRIVFYDEVQFADPSIVHVLEELRAQGRYVVCGGLDLNFLGQPFRTTGDVMAVADRVDKITAHCMYGGCGRPASRSQLLIDGVPVTSAESDIVIEPLDDTPYQARCLEHFVKPEGAISGYASQARISRS